MNIHKLETVYKITITASPDSDPSERRSYTWTEGDPIEHLEMAVAKLQECIAKRRDVLFEKPSPDILPRE